MSEMLGNQYFMARNYSGAQDQLEQALETQPNNKSIKKKLVVCYTQTGKINSAINFFVELIEEDINFIIDTHPIKDDCPCPELIQQIEKVNTINKSSLDFHIVLGIIWLYCDPLKSLQSFEQARAISPENEKIHHIVGLINNFIKNKEKPISYIN